MKYFGMIAEKTGKETETLSFEDSITLEFLKEHLIAKHPQLEKVYYTFAVAMEIINELDHIISSDCEIALLPAFAGG